MQTKHSLPPFERQCFPKEGLATQIFEEPFLHARKRADVDKFIAIAGSTHLGEMAFTNSYVEA